MKIYYSLFLLLVINITLSAQTRKETAVVTLNNGQILYGWINYNIWFNNPKEITFHAEKNATGITYYVKDVKSVKLENCNEYYTREIIPNDIIHEKINYFPYDVSVPANNEEEEIIKGPTRTVFLRTLLKGTISLYEWVENMEVHYYIKTLNSNLARLIYRSPGDWGIATNQPYKEVLARLASSCKDNKAILQLIVKARYAAPDLVNIVKSLNQNNGHISFIASRPKKKIVFGYIGVSAGKTTLEPYDAKLNGTIFNANNGKSIGILGGIDIWLPNETNKSAFLRIECITKWSQYHARILEGWDNYVSHELVEYNISPEVSMIWPFFGDDKYKFMVGGSFQLPMTFLYKEKVQRAGHNDEIAKEKFEYVGWGAAACAIIRANYRWEISGHLNTKRIISESSTSQDFWGGMYDFRLRYHFK